MDIIIVVFVAIFGTEVIRRLLSHREKMRRMRLDELQARVDNEFQSRLEHEVATLRKRVEVLEKLVTDKHHQLGEEIDAL